MDAISTGITNGLQTLQTDALSLLGTAIPEVMPIFAAVLGVGIVLRVARSIAH